ncbi:helix-hairpin-helix domain-containing protein [Lewinella sp. W8]|uniref:ComEA family DNA-binding protein n=1 Tax=Lewinella sp. W8 TaxID=2528208 RepID=UPI0010689BEE|nr:helix-hairpin-helix domain-containing protein [Lewinella sp. W8]MTB53487.1 helix-hairpin-helix domain-containing protein [Lewinella sp. W8]
MRLFLRFLPCFFFLLPGFLCAQVDTTLTDGLDVQETIIEDVIAGEGDESDEFTFNAAFAVLETYRRRPLDLNKATYDELAETLLFTPVQINQLLDYRERLGKFISIYELQTIPSLDLEAIRRAVPFVQIDGTLDDATTPLTRMIAEGNRELFVRWDRRLESARGYELGPEEATNFYLGSPDRLYVKFRQRYGNQMSFGVVAEKDPGETFFGENNGTRNRGFDYYSAHFFLRNVNRTVKAVAIGDYSVSLGQGLILYTGFGYGKSSQTTTVVRGGPVIRPYASVNEFSFMRGGAATLALGEKTELTLFGSRRGRTANIVQPTDTLDIDADLLAVSSLNFTGFNRTPNELEDRNSIQQTSYGGNLRFQPNSRLQLNLNFLGENLSQPLQPRDQPYNRFFFRGTDLQNLSIDYRYRIRNFSFFGEVAASDNGGIAQLHGALVGLDRFMDLAVVYRKFDPDYQALLARPFAETAGGRNEEGLYLGLEARPGKNWRINAYYDIFRHPFLRFNIDAPSSGREYRLRVTYWEKRKLETYVEIRSETKGFGTDGDETIFTNLDPVVDRTRFQGRLHFAYKINPFLEWRSRLDAGFTEDELNGRERGLMLYQDLHYRPRGPWSFSARVALIDTDGFNVRFYQYENGLLYNARVLPYYNRGTRSFLVLRYKGIRGLTLEGRIAQTTYTDGNLFGTGLEATDQSRRTEVGAQAVWRF